MGNLCKGGAREPRIYITKEDQEYFYGNDPSRARSVIRPIKPRASLKKTKTKKDLVDLGTIT